MRGRKILNDVKRLRCLLSISDASRPLGGGSKSSSFCCNRSSSHLLSEVYSDSSSSSSANYDSLPRLYIPSSDLKRCCSSRLGDGDGDGGLAIHLSSSLRGASSANGDSSSSSFVASATLPACSRTASLPLFHRFSTYYFLSSAAGAAYLRHLLSSYQVSAPSSSSSFATTTGETLSVDEDEDEQNQRQQEVGEHDDDEKQQQGFGEVPTAKGHGKQQQHTKEELFVFVEEVARSHSGQQPQQQHFDGGGKVTTDLNGKEGEEESGGVVKDDKSRTPRGWKDLGWTREEVLHWPNAISMARLLSGPLLAWMIVHELWSLAVVGLALAGVSDWLDGYVARRMNTNSVLGSYLDPIADKFLVGSVAVAMAYSGLLHPALVALIVARDGGLMGGAFVYRAYSLKWQWNDWREFFRISIGGASRVEPLYISKVNTVLQLALVGVGLLEPVLSLGDRYSLVPLLSWAVVGTTSLSGIAYIRVYMKNPENLAALARVARASKKANNTA